jgi:hypothetical protein
LLLLAVAVVAVAMVQSQDLQVLAVELVGF